MKPDLKEATLKKDVQKVTKRLGRRGKWTR